MKRTEPGYRTGGGTRKGTQGQRGITVNRRAAEGCGGSAGGGGVSNSDEMPRGGGMESRVEGVGALGEVRAGPGWSGGVEEKRVRRSGTMRYVRSCCEALSRTGGQPIPYLE